MFQRPEDVRSAINHVFGEKAPALRAYIEKHRREADRWIQIFSGLDSKAEPQDGEEDQPLEDDDLLDDEDDERLDNTNLALEIARVSFTPKAEHSLRKDLLSPLGNPPPLTLGELWELADEHLGSAGSSEKTIDQFRSAICDRVGEFGWSSEAYVGRPSPEWRDGERSVCIWSNDWLQFTIHLAKGRRRTSYRYLRKILDNYEPRVSVQVSGWVSERAARALRPTARRLVRAVLWAVSDLHRPRTLDNDSGATGILLEDDDRSPLVSPEHLKVSKEFVTQFISAFWNPRRISHSSRALHNAVTFFVEGTAQRNNDIAITHYCSAMEALVGSGSNVSKILSENVATLLEPDPAARPDAVKLAKTLYDRRSRAVHGGALDSEAADCARTRALSSHVLRAVIERRIFDERLGVRTKSASEDALLIELENARLTAKPIVGVTPSPAARSLWAPSGPAGPTPPN